MSESMSSVEIEDVLSSIRRLVSEDLRPTHRLVTAALQNSAAKLILTPALRVVPADRSGDQLAGAPRADNLDDAGDLQSVLARIDPAEPAQQVAIVPMFGSVRLQEVAQDWPGGSVTADDANFLTTAMSRINGLAAADRPAPETIEAVVAAVGAAVGPDEWEVDGGDPAPQAAAWADTLWHTPDLHDAEPPATDTGQIVKVAFGQTPAIADHAADTGAEFRRVSPGVWHAPLLTAEKWQGGLTVADLAVADLADADLADADLADADLAGAGSLQAAVADRPTEAFAPDADAPDTMQVSDAADTNPAEAMATLVLVAPALAAETAEFVADDAAEPLDHQQLQMATDRTEADAPPAKVDYLSGRDSIVFHLDMTAGRRPQSDTEPAMAQTPRDMVTALVAETVIAEVLHADFTVPDAEVTDTIDQTDSAPDDNDDFISEDILRDIVREMVQAELQGALGERITRDVRKLVRAEINRALAARDYA